MQSRDRREPPSPRRGRSDDAAPECHDASILRHGVPCVPLECMDESALLASLPRLVAEIQDLESQLEECVRVLRLRRLPWVAVGKALGVSRQAAWERFAPHLKASAGDE